MQSHRLVNALLAVALVCAAILAPGGATRAAAALSPAASVPPGLKFTLLTSGLTQPLFVTNAHDASQRLFIVQQTGQIKIWNGSLVAQPFLDISALPSFTGSNGEQGLLALTFDPNYATNRFFYITYTTNTGDQTFPYTTTLARYQVSTGNANLADASTATVLLTIPKRFTNHNGGMIAFGPDGYLYMSMGDGGFGGDPDNNAQNLNVLLGKLLRIDVEHTDPGLNYAIPHTNPFYNTPNERGEVWAYGLRNPWRFSFDSSTGDLFIGDVGQNIEEEVDFQAAGAGGGQNYGWRVLEGNLCYNPAIGCVPPAGYVPPVTVYDHGVNDSFGCAITGGYVYRGSVSPRLQGVYLYGDYCSGKVLGLVRNPDGSWMQGLITNTSFAISSFGVGEDGEMYLTDLASGSVYHITAPEQTISGNVGAANAFLSYSDAGFKEVAADGAGAYTFTVPYGWTGSVTPFLFGSGFAPPSMGYSGVASNQVGQNYTASALPLGGTYDDTDSHWGYSSGWTVFPIPGFDSNTVHVGTSAGGTASFSFWGNGFSLKYLRFTGLGNIGLYLDGSGTPLAMLNTDGAAARLTYASPGLVPGPHVLMLRHEGPTGTMIAFDSLAVLTPGILGAGTYDDGDPAWGYSGAWMAFPLAGAFDNTLHFAFASGSSATAAFHGTGFTLTYGRFSSGAMIGVFIDRNPVPAAILDSNGPSGLTTYTSPVLVSGDHQVTVVHFGPAGMFVITDALQVLP